METREAVAEAEGAPDSGSFIYSFILSFNKRFKHYAPRTSYITGPITLHLFSLIC